MHLADLALSGSGLQQVFRSSDASLKRKAAAKANENATRHFDRQVNMSHLPMYTPS